MDNHDVVALVKFLVRLQAEHMALYHLVGSPGSTDGSFPRLASKIQVELRALPFVSHALQESDVSQLPALLEILEVNRQRTV
jgi:hypothetical protein